MTERDTSDPWRIVFGIAAAGNLANAVWMLVAPTHWYLNLPAGVPDTGPPNLHFIRDVGSAFTVMAAGLAIAAVRPALRLVCVTLVTLFYALHALVHVHDTVTGLLPASHWGIDFPGVYAPALLMMGVTAWLARSERALA